MKVEKIKAERIIAPQPIDITRDQKILSIDVESNGLHGEAFAVGAVLIDLSGEVLDEFQARCPITGQVDLWVEEHVLPPMKNFEETHKSAKAMRDDFWTWFKAAKDQADFVLADNGYPVESRFLISCQDDDLDTRYWDHPFPLLDLSSMLVQAGYKPMMDRGRFAGETGSQSTKNRHNPRWDAWVSALSVIKLWESAGRLG